MSNSPAPVNKQAALENVQSLLEKADKRIASCLPSFLTSSGVIGTTLTTINKSPKILLCSPASIVGTVIQASELGLLLNGVLGEAYMVPFFNTKRRAFECQLQVGYRGLIALARRSGLVSVVRPVLVYQWDELQIHDGSDHRIEHTANYDHPDRGRKTEDNGLVGLRGAYATVDLLPSGSDFEYMPLSRLDELRARSQARDREGMEVGPWTTDPGEMYRKVPIRALAKRLPLSTQFQHAALLDEYGEAGVPQNLASCLEGDATGADVLAEIGKQRASELADKYVRPRKAEPSATHTVQNGRAARRRA